MAIKLIGGFFEPKNFACCKKFALDKARRSMGCHMTIRRKLLRSMPIPLHNNPNSMHLLENSNLRTSRWLLLALAAFPLAIQAEVTVNFDTDLEGLVTAGSGGATVAWSPEFGGSLAYTAPAAFKSDAAKLKLIGGALEQEYQNALTGGGSVTITYHVKQSGIAGTGQPSYFEGILVANTASSYDQEWSANNGVFTTGPFPLTEDFTTTVTLPIVGVAPGGKIDRNSTLEFNTASTYAELVFGLNSGPSGAYTGATVYVSKIVLRGTPPPPGAFYTFDDNAEGFTRYDATNPQVSYSTNFGGSMKLAAKAADSGSEYAFHLKKAITGGSQLGQLQAFVTKGGTLSWDVIGLAGTLITQNYNSTIQVYNTWKFLQIYKNVDPLSVKPIGNGYEIGRVTVDASAYGSDLTVQSGYNFFVGYNGTNEFYFDNLIFTPNTDSGSAVTFDTTAQNFTALAGSTVTAESGGLKIANPGDSTGGASAIFASNSSDPQAAAVYAKLLAASHNGGKLRYKIKRIAVTGPDEFFSGFSAVTSLQAGDALEKFDFISSNDLTVGGPPATETAANYSRTIEVTLDPANSQNPTGIVLPLDAASYEFHIRNDYNGIDVTSLVTRIDDFEVLTTAAPEIVYSPPMPADAGSYVGRVLTTLAPGAVFSATGLPTGLTIDPATGLVTGTPTANGTYHVVFTVTASGGTDSSESMDWVIASVGSGSLPVITSFGYVGGNAVVTWTGAATVNVSRSISLAEGSWEIVSPNNATGTFTDVNSPPGKAFYRLSVP